jgi:cytochrome c oxidase cbb3-type subunit I/II
VPYPERTPQEIAAAVETQGKEITARLKEAGLLTAPDREIVALIAYLQKLGKSEPVAKAVAAAR